MKAPKITRPVKIGIWTFGIIVLVVGSFVYAAYEVNDEVAAEQIAADHVANQHNEMVARTARWLTTQNWMLAELGEDYIAAKIRASEYAAPAHNSDKSWDTPFRRPNDIFRQSKQWVVPTAIIARFDIPAEDHPAAPALIDAQLNFPVVVDTADGSAVSDPRPDISRFTMNFPITDNISAPSPDNSVARLTQTSILRLPWQDWTPYAVE